MLNKKALGKAFKDEVEKEKKRVQGSNYQEPVEDKSNPDTWQAIANVIVDTLKNSFDATVDIRDMSSPVVKENLFGDFEVVYNSDTKSLDFIYVGE